eukprot:TRINITY_DN2452_c0_g1_i1.p1 TRINITY_DN2452_c0_g1~~TRINITY_DN2452_c0_g1_i1.p1  ORF type:complete len:177 (+),score=19.66 TRINITY_DN2452_c0_g1_i1:76-606(+)
MLGIGSRGSSRRRRRKKKRNSGSDAYHLCQNRPKLRRKRSKSTSHKKTTEVELSQGGHIILDNIYQGEFKVGQTSALFQIEIPKNDVEIFAKTLHILPYALIELTCLDNITLYASADHPHPDSNNYCVKTNRYVYLEGEQDIYYIQIIRGDEMKEYISLFTIRSKSMEYGQYCFNL